MKYIDTELLRKEINERLSCNGAFDEVGDSAWHYDQGIIAAYKHILSFIDSLQQEQPKVDLEKYIENVVNHYGLSLYEASYKTFSACDIDRIIRNAFELGINARNE